MPESKGVAGLIVRGLVIAFAVGAIVAAAVAVGTLNDLLGSATETGGLDLVRDTRGASGWIIFVGIMAIIIMALFIVLGIASKESTILQAVGIVFSILLGLGYLAGGIAAAIFARDWDDFGDLLIGGLPSELERVMISLAAAAGLCFVSVILLLILLIVSILFLVQKD